jgi:hypothetical protein
MCAFRHMGNPEWQEKVRVRGYQLPKGADKASRINIYGCLQGPSTPAA